MTLELFHYRESLRNLTDTQISFAHNLFRGCPNVLKLCIEHGSNTAVLWEKFQND